MNDLLEFLTSQEIIIVYIIAALACLICFIVYLVEKNNEKLRLRHNTRELNKLVEEIKALTPEEAKAELYDTPVLENIIEQPEKPMVIGPINVEETVDLSEVVEEVKKYEDEVIEEEPEDELEYTSIEPDQETARLELERLKEQLEREELREQEEVVEPTPVEVQPVQTTEPQIEAIETVNEYEEEQEKTAIISLEELLAKSKEMYEANELTQYKDEGNEPISIQDLEIQVQRQAATYDEPFIIANVVPEEELQEGINEAFEQIVQEEKEVLHVDDMNTISEETVNPVVKEEVRKFQASPIISPIFGIERDTSKDNALSLENTANYDKLDAAMRKNNEFYMSISELQGKTE